MGKSLLEMESKLFISGTDNIHLNDQQKTENQYLDIAPNLRATFVPLPSDPSIPLTPEQLDALFPPANRPAFLRQLVQLTHEIPYEEADL